MAFDIEKIRKDFPILKNEVDGKRLVYLDSAATSQKPRQVINAVSRYYKNYNANIHRGIYRIAEEATEAYVKSKETLAKFIGAKSYREIVYVRNTTEAINLVALTYAATKVKENDHILLTRMEHHSNMVPWQMLAKKKGAIVDYAELVDNKFVDMEDYKRKLENEPKIVAFTHVSNVLGTINDAKEMTRLAHEHGATVLVDGAQSAPHMPINVREIGCDFFALSSHKMLGPSGIGALYGREEALEEMEPLFGGGEMIRSVSYDSCTWNDLPWKFEAGTQNIEGAIGLGAAIRYLKRIGMEEVRNHEKRIVEYALKRISEVDGVEVYGPGIDHLDKKAGVLSFNVKGIHAHDVAAVFDSENVAIRSGHHCAMPIIGRLTDQGAAARMSFYIYNDEEDVDRAIDAIEKAKKKFGAANL